MMERDNFMILGRSFMCTDWQWTTLVLLLPDSLIHHSTSHGLMGFALYFKIKLIVWQDSTNTIFSGPLYPRDNSALDEMFIAALQCFLDLQRQCYSGYTAYTCVGVHTRKILQIWCLSVCLFLKSMETRVQTNRQNSTCYERNTHKRNLIKTFPQKVLL